MKTAAELVSQQLKAYNDRDIDAFMACYAADVKLWRVGGERLAQGHEEMRQQYKELFEKNAGVTALLKHRISSAHVVIDHELILGRSDGMTVEAYAMFEVHEEKITEVWFKTIARYPACTD